MIEREGRTPPARGKKSAKIGLEIHCQLTSLKTKLFCSCSSDYRDANPNEKVCPVCFGLPGTLPVLNAKAVEHAVMIGLSLNSTIPEMVSFYRKNYFYPDLPKNFQISQYDKAGGVPIAVGGYLEIDGDAAITSSVSEGEGRKKRRRIRVRRLQLEEDPGKLTYEGTIEKSAYSLVDYNRAGIALVEIVTEPDFETAREAKAFLEKLRSTLESLGVSDGELEGAMRCDANISMEGGARVEIKNISSFKEVEKALNYEILRQGTFSGSAASETRHWDERRSITIALRLKEGEQDYRYFPEPDLPPVILDHDAVEKIRRSMPEVADARAARFERDYGISAQLANELASDTALSSFFERSAEVPRLDAREGYRPALAGFILSELKQYVVPKSTVGITPERAYELFQLVENRRITRVQARTVLRDMSLDPGKGPGDVISSRGMSAVVVDSSSIERVVEGVVVATKPEMRAEARANAKVFNFLVGQVLKNEPSAEPKLVAKILATRLREEGKKK